MQGIGIDIIELSRMAETLARSGQAFSRRVFTAGEMQRGRGSENPVAFFASTFAAKEAVFKALVLDWDQGVELTDIEVDRGPLGEPLVRLHGAARARAEAKGCARVLLSLSYETDLAVAMAMADGDPPFEQQGGR